MLADINHSPIDPGNVSVSGKRPLCVTLHSTIDTVILRANVLAEAFCPHPPARQQSQATLPNTDVAQLRTERVWHHSTTSPELKYRRFPPARAEDSSSVNVFSRCSCSW